MCEQFTKRLVQIVCSTCWLYFWEIEESFIVLIFISTFYVMSKRFCSRWWRRIQNILFRGEYWLWPVLYFDSFKTIETTDWSYSIGCDKPHLLQTTRSISNERKTSLCSSCCKSIFDLFSKWERKCRRMGKVKRGDVWVVAEVFASSVGESDNKRDSSCTRFKDYYFECCVWGVVESGDWVNSGGVVWGKIVAKVCYWFGIQLLHQDSDGSNSTTTILPRFLALPHNNFWFCNQCRNGRNDTTLFIWCSKHEGLFNFTLSCFRWEWLFRNFVMLDKQWKNQNQNVSKIHSWSEKFITLESLNWCSWSTATIETARHFTSSIESIERFGKNYDFFFFFFFLLQLMNFHVFFFFFFF